MSLISQNVALNRKDKRTGEDTDTDVASKEDRGKSSDDGFDLDESTMKKRKKKKAKRVEVEEEKEMKRLETLLFGALHSPVRFGKEDREEVLDKTENGPAIFFTDRSASKDFSLHEEDVESLDYTDDEDEKDQRKPAWVDEEEERAKVNIANVNRLRKLRKEEKESVISGSEYVLRLRAQHVKLNPATEWAQPASRSMNYEGSSDDEENGVVVTDAYKDTQGLDDILRTDEDLVVKNGAKLLPGLLEYSRLVDANAQDPSNAPISSVQFHRNAQLLLSSGLDRRIRFFQIDGKRNTKVQSIFLEDCPVRKACFSPDGSQVIASGRRKFFYTFDLINAKVDKIGPLVGREEKSLEYFEVSPDSTTIAFVGNEGYILLVSSRTKELVGTLKMNGTVRSLAFADNGQQLLSFGGDGHVYHWDLRTMTCLHKAVDEGCVNGTSLCTSPDNALFAAGSDSGIVNVYNRRDFLGGKRKPLKTIENLTTKVDFLKFNNDAQILAICSGMKKNSLKLVHVPSFTVFSNFPLPNRTFEYPRCVDYSPGGGFMVVGNAAGRVLLYKLHHYQRA